MARRSSAFSRRSRLSSSRSPVVVPAQPVVDVGLLAPPAQRVRQDPQLRADPLARGVDRQPGLLRPGLRTIRLARCLISSLNFLGAGTIPPSRGIRASTTPGALSGFLPLACATIARGVGAGERGESCVAEPSSALDRAWGFFAVAALLPPLVGDHRAVRRQRSVREFRLRCSASRGLDGSRCPLRGVGRRGSRFPPCRARWPRRCRGGCDHLVVIVADSRIRAVAPVYTK